MTVKINPVLAHVVKVDGVAVKIDPSVAQKKKYEILFRKCTPEEEHQVFLRMPKGYTCAWLVILMCHFGWINTPIMCFLYICCYSRWAFGCHESMHQKTKPPFWTRMFFPISGFTPISMCWGDLGWDHNVHHHVRNHSTCDVIEIDREGMLGVMPILNLLGWLIINPSHHSFLEVLEAWQTCPVEHWPERLCLQACHYFQYYILWNMGLLLPVLITGHIASVILYFFFHGLIHRKSFYELMNQDPSGERKIWWFDPIVHLVMPASGWWGLKFHDIHHAFPESAGTLSSRAYLEGYNFVKVYEAAYDLVDEGFFVDENGDRVDHMAKVGHELGMRKRWLRSQNLPEEPPMKLKKVESSQMGGKFLPNDEKKSESDREFPLAGKSMQTILESAADIDFAVLGSGSD